MVWSRKSREHNDIIIEGTTARIVVTDSRESNDTQQETPSFIKGASLKVGCDVSSGNVITVISGNLYLQVPSVCMR